MNSKKTIAAIGLADEDVAHLRLIMRKATAELTHPWQWGAENVADLLIIDVSEFSAQMARLRALATGIRVAVVGDEKADAGSDLALHRPFRLANVVEVLNQVAGSAPNPAGIIAQKQNAYYASESGSERESGLLDDDGQDEPVPLRGSEDVAPGLDEMIRGNPLLDPFANVKDPKLDDSVGFEAVSSPTRRSELRHDSETGPRSSERSTHPNQLPPSKRPLAEDRSPHALRDYLADDLLSGPAQITWEDQATLTLDPKNKVFHSDQPLSALEVYCCSAPRRGDWRTLTTAEITRIREAQPAQPYIRLVWLDTLIRSGGRLASNLDPGGTYKLTQWLDIRHDYPRHARVSTAMLQPLRLHEIAAAAGVDMNLVFDVVNAYDAIGWLEWTPRAPRHAEPESQGGLRSFVKRLRKPFGK